MTNPGFPMAVERMDSFPLLPQSKENASPSADSSGIPFLVILSAELESPTTESAIETQPPAEETTTEVNEGEPIQLTDRPQALELLACVFPHCVQVPFEAPRPATEKET